MFKKILTLSLLVIAFNSLQIHASDIYIWKVPTAPDSIDQALLRAIVEPKDQTVDFRPIITEYYSPDGIRYRLLYTTPTASKSMYVSRLTMASAMNDLDLVRMMIAAGDDPCK